MPGITWKFIDYGRAPAPGGCELALDVSSPHAGAERVFDHHDGAGPDISSTGAVLRRRGELEVLRNCGKVTIYCHKDPDMDCAAASCLAMCVLRKKLPRPEVLDRIAEIVPEVDQGHVLPVSCDFSRPSGDDFNFYTFFLYLSGFLRQLKDSQKDKNWNNLRPRAEELGIDCRDNVLKSRFGEYMLYSVLFLDLLLSSESALEPLQFIEGGKSFRSLSRFIDSAQGPFREVLEAMSDFFKDEGPKAKGELSEIIRRKDYEVFPVRVPGTGGEVREVPALAITASESCLPLLKGFRGLAFPMVSELRDTPFHILAFAPKNDQLRVVFSMSPEYRRDFTLKGLALALERENRKKKSFRTRDPETARWRRMIGGVEKADPLFPSKDPWYDGRGHGFTIVDAPQIDERFLPVARLFEILKSDWHLLAKEYETDEYKNWMRGAEIV